MVKAVAMRTSPRCGAKTRRGTSCQSPAVLGKQRCRMHGGAKGSGAPIGNQNSLKHGLYAAEANSLRRHIRELTQKSKELIETM
jgi:uncharacterized protein YjcR